MNLRQLAYFQAVIEHGSLAAASEALGVAQPNLSVAIRQLETEWDVTLFDRRGRGLSVTDTGRLLFDRASQLLGVRRARRIAPRSHRGFDHVRCGKPIGLAAMKPVDVDHHLGEVGRTSASARRLVLRRCSTRGAGVPSRRRRNRRRSQPG